MGRPRKIVEKAPEAAAKAPVVSAPVVKVQRNRPRAFHTVEELDAVINDYFDGCDERGEVYGEAGLMLALNVGTMTFDDWWHGRHMPEYTPSIRRACLRIQDQLETGRAYMDKGMVTKSIFLLKQVRLGGRQDKVESRQDINVDVKFGQNFDESDMK